MRLLIALSQYHRAAGYPRYGVDLTRSLAARGHDVTVLSRLRETEPADAGIHFEDYTVLGSRNLPVMLSEPFMLTRRLRELMGDYDATVVIGIPVLAPAVLIGLGAQKGFYKNTLRTLGPRSLRYWVERVRPFHKAVMVWEWAMMRKPWPPLVVVGAQPYAHEYPEGYGYPAERVVDVPMGVDLDTFGFDADLRATTRADLGLDDDTPFLLNIAGRARQKALDVVVDSLHRLPTDRPWTMAFAGDGSSAPWLDEATRDLQASGRVRLLGRVPDVVGLYCAADLVVFPSRYDPWGLVNTEALGCGTPVVTSATVGSSVGVVEGVNGTVIPDPDDAAALTAAITSMLDRLDGDGFDRDEMRRSVEWLTYDEGAARLEAVLLERIVGPDGRGGTAL